MRDAKPVANPDKLQAHVHKLRTKLETYRRNLVFLSDTDRMAQVKTAHDADLALAQRCLQAKKGKQLSEVDLYRQFLTAQATAKRAHADSVRESDPQLASWLVNSTQAHGETAAAAVFLQEGAETPGAVSSRKTAPAARQVTMFERELFGEMACRNRKPRAATVKTTRPCYVLEMLSNVLEILETDEPFEESLKRTYRDRLLELHLRSFSLFRHLSESRFEAIHSRIRNSVDVKSITAKGLICDEGASSDAVYLIRQGWLQVKVRQGSHQHIVAYRGPGEFIGEMALIRTAEQSAALKQGDFTGVLQTMPEPGPRTATCVAWGHTYGKSPDLLGKVELVGIPYKEFWELIKASNGIREEIVAEVEHRRSQSHRQPIVPDVRGSANVLFAEELAPLGLHQGQSLMLFDLDRCTRCDECVKACVDTHKDGRSRLFLDGPRAYIDGRTFLAPTTCQSCEDPVCMIGCPTRAIQRGDKCQMVIDEKTCIGCHKCADNCPYNAIQMHDIGLISAPGYLNPRIAGDKWKETDDKQKKEDAAPPTYGWYCCPAADISEKRAALCRTSTTPPRGWIPCAAPFYFRHEFRRSLATEARRASGREAVSPKEALCFWRTFSIPVDRQDWDGQILLTVESAHDLFKAWIDGHEITGPPNASRTRKYRHQLSAPARRGWRWWRKNEVHVLAMQVVPNCALEAKFLEVRLDAVKPLPVPWDILEEVTEQKPRTELAVVCDLCGTSGGGPACIRACPHDATRRFDARIGMKEW